MSLPVVHQSQFESDPNPLITHKPFVPRRQVQQPQLVLSQNVTVQEHHPPKKDLFKTELCAHFELHKNCPFGNECWFAHGTHELRPVLRHPFYKTRQCKSFHETGYCKYGTRCWYIHAPPPLPQPKTVKNFFVPTVIPANSVLSTQIFNPPLFSPNIASTNSISAKDYSSNEDCSFYSEYSVQDSLPSSPCTLTNSRSAVQRPSKKFVGLSFTDSQKDAKEVLTSDYIVKRTVPDAGDGADEALSPDE